MLFGFILLVGLATCGCAGSAAEPGWLTGHVTIGPLQPVVQEGVPEPSPGPDTYAARQVVIFSEDGQREVQRAAIDPSGVYRAELSPGVYLVDINHAGIDFAKGLPVMVEIASGQEIRLDIDIDTGIR
jgi:hypothetical protein